MNTMDQECRLKDCTNCICIYHNTCRVLVSAFNTVRMGNWCLVCFDESYLNPGLESMLKGRPGNYGMFIIGFLWTLQLRCHSCLALQITEDENAILDECEKVGFRAGGFAMRAACAIMVSRCPVPIIDDEEDFDSRSALSDGKDILE